MITPELNALLCWGVPKMTDLGRTHFDALMEQAVRNVIEQVFDQTELESFRVTKMVQIGAITVRTS